MDLGIHGRLAVVTGASSGLGRACALALAAEGARVVVAARRAAELTKVAEELDAAGAAGARAEQLDLHDAASVQRFASIAGEADIFVANGGGPKPATFMQTGASDWDGAYQLLLRSQLELIHAAAAGMRARKWGRIVALTSTSVKQPIQTLALSNMFRTALVSGLKTLSSEIASAGVTVNAIATGRIETDRLRSLYGGQEQLHAAGNDVPAGRIGRAEELAALAAFLCSEHARYLTGQTIAVDGGLIAGTFG